MNSLSMVSPRVESAFQDYCHTGDPDALAEVYDATADRLLRAAVHLAPSMAAAEDLLQATSVAVIESSSRFDRGRPLMPWLLGILGNQAKLQAWRHSREPDVSRLPKPLVEDPGQRAEAAEFDQVLAEIIDSLPEVYRPVLYLRLRHGLSTGEIGLSLGRAAGTVRAQLSRGLERLRRALPVDYVGAMAVAMPFVLEPIGRGIGAVREAVLAHASSQVSVISMSSVLGSLVMKKWISSLVAAALLIVASTWFFYGDGVDADPAAPANGDQAVRSQAAVLRPPASLTSGDHQRELVRAVAIPRTVSDISSPDDKALAHLNLRVVWRESQRPAPGVRVVVRSGLEASVGWGEWVTRLTDDAGLITCTLEPGVYQLRGLRGGESDVLLKANETTEAVLGIPNGYAVTVRVRDGNDRPVADAAIWLSEPWSSTRGHIVGHSDTAGQFRMEHIRHDHQVAVRRSGYSPSRQYLLHAAVGAELAINVVIVPGGGTITGLVSDVHGRPVAGARVLLGEEEARLSHRHEDGSHVPGSPPRLVVTGSDGRFAVESLPLGVIPVQVRAKLLATWKGEVTVSVGSSELEVRLSTSPLIRGRVTKSDGTPSALAQIITGKRMRFATRIVSCDVEGNYELMGLPIGDLVLVANDANDPQLTARHSLVLSAEETEDWSPVLSIARTESTVAADTDGAVGIGVPLTGLVIDRSGNPVVGVRVVARRTNPPRDSLSCAAVTNAQGEFLINTLVGWKVVSLRVMRPGDWRLWPIALTARVNIADSPVTITLPDPETELAQVRGQVVDAAGVGVSALIQVWHQQHELWRSLSTDAKTGKFEMQGVWPGTLQLEIRSAEHPWLKLANRVVVAGELVDLGVIGLRASARVRGLLTLRGGALPTDIRGSVEDAEKGSELGVVSIHSGVFVSNPLASGDYRLLITGSRVETRYVPFAVAAGVDTQLNVSLNTAALRRVRVILPKGHLGTRWARVMIRGVKPQRVLWIGAATERSQWLVESALPIGEHEVRITTSDGLKGRSMIQVLSLEDAARILEIAVSTPK